MSGGGGFMQHAQVSMRQNRKLRSSQQKKFGSNRTYLTNSTQNTKSAVPKTKADPKLIQQIRNNYAQKRKKKRILNSILLVIFLIGVLSMLVILNK